MNNEEIVIDGTKFNTFLEFVDHMNEIAFDNFKWNDNLDAFNDLLRGGFGNKIEQKSVRWIHSKVSKEKLGYSETILFWTERMKSRHPADVEYLERQIADAEKGIGQTLYDIIVEILNDHGPDGTESGDLESIAFE